MTQQQIDVEAVIGTLDLRSTHAAKVADLIRRMMAENERLRAALKQALRQWEMYAEMVERPVDGSWKLSTEKSPEGDIYRAAHDLAHEQSALSKED